MQARLYNHQRWLEEMEIGDEVLINPHTLDLDLVDVKGMGRKLLQQRISPFTIMEKISPVVYWVHLPAEY